MKLLYELDQLLFFPRGGISVYSCMLLQEMMRLGIDFQLAHASVKPLRNFPGLMPFDASRRKVLPVPGRLLEYTPFARWAEWYFSRGCSIYHSLSGLLPPWYSGKIPAILTIHDMGPFRDREENQTDAPARWYCEQMKRAVQRAACIITVSEFTRRELCEILAVESDKVQAIPNASQYTPAALSEEHPLPPEVTGCRYFLAVSVLSPRKNYETLLEAWQRFRQGAADCRLVIVGRPGWRCDALLRQLKNTPGVIHYESLPPEMLLALYRNTVGYFNLSLYEGFGIPLLEAMHCGAPCCYARGSAMDELCSDSGIGVPARDLDAVIDVMKSFYSDDALRSGLKEKAIVRASQYTWEKTAKQHLAVYRRIADAG